MSDAPRLFNSTVRAYEDKDFLASPDCTGIRLELEYLKPELQMERKRVTSTIVVFGSARLKSPEEATEALGKAEAALAEKPEDEDRKRACTAAKKMLENSKYYAMAREFSQIVTTYDQNTTDGFQFVTMTGGGGGIMEAGNRGAADMGGISVGLNITLPFEQHPNPFITPDLSFLFHYFSVRKMHFMKRAKCLAAFPGGFGTMDELFEALTLVQTKIIDRIPILLFGKEFWENLINWQLFIDNGLISPEDLDLFHYCDSAWEGWNLIKQYYHI